MQHAGGKDDVEDLALERRVHQVALHEHHAVGALLGEIFVRDFDAGADVDGEDFAAELADAVGE